MQPSSKSDSGHANYGHPTMQCFGPHGKRIYFQKFWMTKFDFLWEYEYSRQSRFKGQKFGIV